MAPNAHIRVQIGDASAALPVFDLICELYDFTFSQPPFFWRDDESQLHRERLHQLLRDPTFGITIAHWESRLVGFAYGITVPDNSTRWASLKEPVDHEVAAEWPGRTFLLFDFAVEAASRGRGVGRRLHHGLLGSRPEERSTLTVQPTALETKDIYEHWHWRKVGQMNGGPNAAAPVFDVYLRPTLDDLRCN